MLRFKMPRSPGKANSASTVATILGYFVQFALLCSLHRFCCAAAQQFQHHQQQFQQPQYQNPQHHQQPPQQQQQFQNAQQQKQQQPQAGGWNADNFLKREHSLLRPYSAGGTTIPQWDFAGNTMVTNNFIRLTPDVGSMRGTLWNNVPVNMINWELQVQFQVHGAGKDLFGDGFAVWYARDRMLTGTVFGSQDYFSGLAVFADTYSNHNGEHNHEHPLVSTMLNNGTLHYDHDRDGTHTQLASCTAKFRNKNYPTFLAIRYEHRRLTVSVDIDNKHEWRQCLSIDNVELPTGYYIGFSASTGDLADNHDIISVRMYQLDAVVDYQAVLARRGVVPFAASAEPERPHIPDVKPSTVVGAGRKFLTVMWYVTLALVICVILGVCGWFAYQRFGQQQKRKRFY